MRWGLAVLCAAVCGVLWAYYWRVFFGLDNRVSPLVVTLGCAAFLEVCLLAGYCVRRFAKGFAAKGAVCIFLCGLLFAFANPPLQTPDEADHYLRTYAISTGHFDFDASRTYPDDVAYLLEAFPGAWVNAHTSAGVGTDPDTGAKKPITPRAMPEAIRQGRRSAEHGGQLCPVPGARYAGFCAGPG